MAALRIAVVWCAVAALGVGAWNVPRIPSGRRTQFYLQKDDSAYQYGYDTGDGHSAQATADAANEVRGQFDYVGADGRAVGVRYSAGQGGYVPTVSGVEVPGAPAAAAAAAYAGARSGAGAGLAAGGSAADQDPDYDANADASYSFNIDTDSYKRSEQADARGNVRGQYSYNSAKGGSHALSYVAGEGTGFVVTGGSSSASAAHAASGAAAARIGGAAPAGPVSSYSGPLSNAQGSSGVDGSYSFSFGTNEQSRQESADAQNNVRGSYSFRAKDDGKTRRVDYVAGAATGFVASGDHLPVAPEVSAGPSSRTSSFPAPAFPAPAFPAPAFSAPAATPYSGPLADIQSGAGGDGSYSFAFGTDLQSRQESADAQNNVRGSYSFRSKDDGQTRRVDYVAGAATGFVATGDHLPVAPSVGASGAPVAPSVYTAPAPSRGIPYSGPASNAQGSANADGSYSFSFNTNEQSRQESSDAQNNVRGSYSFRAKDDGKTRRVDYVAGAATGFVASGDHLPVAPEVPSAPGAGVTVSAYSAPVIPAAPAFPAPTTSYSGAAADAQGSSGVDGSYSFSFNTNQQSRQESADSRNNVRGSYSFTAPDDGKTRRVDYEAGSATGFVAKGAHLPVAPAVPAVSGVSSVPAVSVYSAHVVPAIPASSYSGPASNAQGSANADGSYSFSFSSNDQSRQESADAKNNVRGSYSFKAKDDGQTRRVDYVAGAATGFVASGDHLPKASSAPGSPVAPGVHGVVAARLGSGSASAGASAANADGSYSFAYDAGDHSRQEASDAAGNVRGSFSFVAKDDGQARRVDYAAGAATGFLASGAHLPVAGAPGGGTGAVAGRAGGGGSGGVSSYAAASSGASDAASGDASYSYSYQTDSSSKAESSDAQGNVRGEFSYVGGDGATRRVAYTARNEEGFVASGDLGPAGAAAGAGVGGGAATASVVAARAGTGVGSASHSSHSSHGSHGAHGAHGAISVRTGGALINQYLPPQSAHKYGYIYDSKV